MQIPGPVLNAWKTCQNYRKRKKYKWGYCSLGLEHIKWNLDHRKGVEYIFHWGMINETTESDLSEINDE